MEGLLSEYLPILIFIGIATAIACVAVLGSYIVAPQRPDVKRTQLTNAVSRRSKTHVTSLMCAFTLVAILFIIFDLEVAFLVPVGDLAGQHRRFWLLVDDGVPWHSYHRIRLRVA